MNRLAQKVAFVTGGSRGIGAAIARRLAGEGAHVVITYTSAAEKAQEVVRSIEQAGGKAVAIAADNADPQAVTEAVRQTASQFGRIDVVVNNAGIYIGKPLEEHTLEDFDRIMNINVRAVFLAIREAAQHMPDGGRMITIGSNMADRAGGPQTALYSMSKSALVGLTKGLARDLGPRSITVNLVQPGPIDTDMNPANTAFADQMRSQLSLAEYGTGDDIAGLVAYLASDEGKFVTGSMLTIDGGFNA